MKKVLAILVILVLMSSFAASAEITADTSAAMLGVMIGQLETTAMFDWEKSKTIAIGETVMVTLETVWTFEMLQLAPDAVCNFLSVMWTSFNDIHAMFSKGNMLLFISKDDVIFFYTDGGAILDCDGNEYPFVRQI